MNVQFAIKNDEIYVLEVNPRASRTVPFVAKAVNSPIAAIAARIMAGEKLSAFNLKSPKTKHYAVKEAVLPFSRFPGVDTLLGPEMRSTGEVMGLDKTFARAFLKAQMGAGHTLPSEGTVFMSVKNSDKTPQMVEAAQILHDAGFTILATRGTAGFLKAAGIETETVNKVYEGRPNIVDRLRDGVIDLVFNTTEGTASIEDSREIRSVALYSKIVYYTTAAASYAAAQAIRNIREGALEVAPLQEY